MNIECKKYQELTEQEKATWLSLSRQPAYASPFFHPEYTHLLSNYRDQVEVAVFTDDAQPVGFLPFERHGSQTGRPLGVKLADFQGLVSGCPLELSESELLRGMQLGCLHFDHFVSTPAIERSVTRLADSPFMDLSNGFDAYLQDRRANGNRSLTQLPRKQRKLEREVGHVEFVWNDPDPQAAELLYGWKAAQRERTATVDILDYPWVRDFLAQVCREDTDHFAGLISTLRANGQILAVHLGLRTDRVLHYWFPAYDREFSRYSPGQILLYRLAEEAAARAMTTVDLGKGDDSYKSSFASGSRTVCVGTVDRNPTRRRIRTSISQLKGWMKRSGLRSSLQVPIRLLKQWQSNATMGAS